jgi:hypothetical protein
METQIFNNDITVFYVTAPSFPAGVMEAHNKLHALVSFENGRKLFGLSRPENGKIVYMAAAEELQQGEGEKLGCPTMVLKKGNYICETITGFMQNIPAIEKAFNQLTSQPGIDPQGYCVEWYFNDKDVKCMVRLEK